MLVLGACAAPVRATKLLAGFAPFEGCWVGAFASPEGLRDQRCVTTIYDGQFVRDVHAVIGAGYGGETIYSGAPSR